MILVLLGAPGAGKGTQAEWVCKEFDIPSISTGDLLRAEVKENSDLGKKAKSFMDKGELVTDSLIVSMLEKRIQLPDCSKGFILDGFPRNTSQADTLNQMLSKLGKSLDAVVNIDVDPESIVQRLSNRLTCSSCKAGFNRLTKKPKVEGICDVCGGALIQREDDKEATIRNRLSVYEKQTSPLIAYYSKTGKLIQINGNQDMGAVQKDIINKLKSSLHDSAKKR
jgi:adenylate kinase